MRKTLKSGTDKQVREAVERFKMLTDVRYEMAMDAYNAQDSETKEVLERIRDVLRLAATGYIEVAVDPPHTGVVPVKIEQEYTDRNLMFIATEILKTLALFDVRVASYKFPPSVCVECGAEITGQKAKRKKVRRG